MGFDGTRADRYADILRDGSPLGARLAAAAQAARRQVRAGCEHERAIRDVAAGVAAPLLVAYVLWLLEDARARGIERLYFLSRDAEILLDLARILAPRLGLAIELRYLYASRRAWLGAGPDAWPWDNAVPDLTVADVLDQLSVAPEAVADDLAGLGFERLDTRLDSAGRRRLRTFLLASGLLAGDCPARRDDGRLLHDYLDQEGMFDGVPKAVVDLGGHGTQHAALCNFLEQNGEPPCPLYLFWGEPYDGWSWMDLRRCFHFDGADETAGLQPMSHVMMEAFCSAEHGTLTGFRRDATGRALPVLGSDRTEVLAAWGLPLLRETLAAFARSFDPAGIARREVDCTANPRLRETLTRLSDAFWLAPRAEEARAWCRFPWDLGDGEDALLGTPYGFADIPAVLQTKRLRKSPAFWVPGALALTPYPVATALQGLRGAIRAGRWARQKALALGRLSALPTSRDSASTPSR